MAGTYFDDTRAEHDGPLASDHDRPELRKKLSGGDDRAAAIPRALDELSDAIGDLDTVLSSLIGRIEPALRENYENRDGVMKVECDPDSGQLARRLAVETARVRELFYTFQNVNSRVEL